MRVDIDNKIGVQDLVILRNCDWNELRWLLQVEVRNMFYCNATDF
jgi:hypothetical protein